jgi:hypothetical protein
MKQKQITIDGITYNHTPVKEPKPASPFHISDANMTWQKAMDHATSKKMRLLESHELHKLIVDKKLSFKAGTAWSSSSVYDFPSYAWYVHLFDGYTYYGDKTNTHRAFCAPLDFSLAEYLKEQA